MKITIGEIVNNPAFAFLKLDDVVSIKKLRNNDADALYDKYVTWCRKKNIMPDVKHCFYNMLWQLGSVTSELFDTVFKDSFDT